MFFNALYSALYQHLLGITNTYGGYGKLSQILKLVNPHGNYPGSTLCLPVGNM